MRLPPSSALFPYATLFRSKPAGRPARAIFRGCASAQPGHSIETNDFLDIIRRKRANQSPRAEGGRVLRQCASKKFCRSEEHTSELQSRQYLVCRLLLEKIN